MVPSRPRFRRGALLVSGAVLMSSALASCSAPDAGTTAETTRSQATPTQQGPPRDGSPLTALPPCGTPPAALAAVKDVPGLVLPAGAVLTAPVRVDAQLTTVEGYIATTPIRVRQFYQDEPNLTILNIEDEIFESEVLVGRGEFRTYAKATAVCAEGSTLYAVVGPAGDTALPTLGTG